MSLRLIACAILCLSVTATTGCLGVATPAQGLLITDVKWDGEAKGKFGRKRGKACAKSILGLVASGDASIEAAARDGGITSVTSVDHETNWTVVIGEYCTIVRGT